jgi:hypothetical protein
MKAKMRAMTDRSLNAETSVEFLKSIITQPLTGQALPAGRVVVRGAAYSGESDVDRVEVSVDAGATRRRTELISPHELSAWRQRPWVWVARDPGAYTLRARAIDDKGQYQNNPGIERLAG